MAPTFIVTDSRHLSHNKKLQRNKSMGKIKAGKGNTIKTKKEEATAKPKKKTDK